MEIDPEFAKFMAVWLVIWIGPSMAILVFIDVTVFDGRHIDAIVWALRGMKDEENKEQGEI